MIYILAPFNLSINTTSRNRILSFYKGFREAGLETTIINPPLLARDREVYLNGFSPSGMEDNKDFVSLNLKENLAERLVAQLIPNPNYKKAAAIINLLFLIFNGRDFNYPANSLNVFFRKKRLQPQDIIIASGSPFSLFNAACTLSKTFKCKLILDYRDPWTYGYAPIDAMPVVSKLKKCAARRAENRSLDRAHLVNCDSLSVKGLFPEIYQDKINVILNGANLQAINLQKITGHYPIFRIVYLGTIYNDQLSDETFFKALKTFIQKKQLNKYQFELIFVGSNKNNKLPLMLSKFDLETFTTVTERLNIEEAMEIAYTASLFLHLKYGNRAEVDTSKHLDYLALQKPVLLPMSDYGNVAKGIIATNSGYVCSSAEDCCKVLEVLWEKHAKGENFKIQRNKEFLYSISREAEADKLVSLVKTLETSNLELD